MNSYSPFGGRVPVGLLADTTTSYQHQWVFVFGAVLALNPKNQAEPCAGCWTW